VQLKAGLVPFIAELREDGTQPDASVLSGQFDSKAQVNLLFFWLILFPNDEPKLV